MNFADRKVSKISYIDGIGYESFLVILFTFLKSWQNLYSPFLVLIMTIGFDQSEQEGSIIPCFKISSIFKIQDHEIQIFS